MSEEFPLSNRGKAVHQAIQYEYNKRVAAQSVLWSLQQTVNAEIVALVGMSFHQFLTEAMSKGTVAAMFEVNKYATKMEDSFSDVRKGLATDAERLGQQVADRAWDIVNGERVRPNIDSRTSSRLHGTLQRAIYRMIQPTYDGVVIRVDVLDQEARHWRRLNYGIGPRSGDGHTSAIPNMAQEGPVAGEMMMPEGFWYKGSKRVPFAEGAHNDIFFPNSIRSRMRGQKQQMKWYFTQGIAGSHFLERAFETAQVQFPNIVRERLTRWAQTMNAGSGSYGVAVKGDLGPGSPV